MSDQLVQSDCTENPSISKWAKIQLIGFWSGLIVAIAGCAVFLWVEAHEVQIRKLLARGSPGYSYADHAQLVAASSDMMIAMMAIATLGPVAVILTMLLSLASAIKSGPWPKRKMYAVLASLAFVAALWTLNTALQQTLKGPY